MIFADILIKQAFRKDFREELLFFSRAFDWETSGSTETQNEKTYTTISFIAIKYNCMQHKDS